MARKKYSLEVVFDDDGKEGTIELKEAMDWHWTKFKEYLYEEANIIGREIVIIDTEE